MTIESADPKARGDSIIEFGRARFSVLTPRMIRMEWATDGAFEDRATLSVVNRRLPKAAFRTRIDGNRLTIDTGEVQVRYTDTGRPLGRTNLAATFTVGGRPVTWYPGMKDTENLGGTVRTLDLADGDRFLDPRHLDRPGRRIDLGQGLVSRSGWAAVDDSKTIVLDEHPDAACPWVRPRDSGRRQDIYLLAHGRDYRGALAEASRVFGQQPLPPRYALGYWYSRYWAYMDKEIEELVRQFDQMHVPLDVMVIDMDWHLMGWTGYTWDRNYFPDPDEFLGWLKSRSLKITLNLHPALGVGRHEAQFKEMCRRMGLSPRSLDCVPLDVTDPRYMSAYFEVLHHPQEQRGVDFWWMDWQQGETTAMAGLDTLPWINQLHWEDMQRNPRRKGLRPLCFSRYGGLGAGRYPVGFSGDTFATWKSLAYQPQFTATAANVLYGYWSHDIGGHQPGKVPGELYTRWVQFGIFSPVMRTHTTKDPESERRPWQFPEPYDRAVADALRLRYEMVPYVYAECRKCVDTGVSLVHPMYYDWPDEPAAYEADGQYMFGDQLLVAPVVQPADTADEMAEVSVWLPPGKWFDMALGQAVTGGRTLRRKYLLDEVPVFARPGTVVPGQRAPLRLEPGSYADLVVTIVPGAAEGRYDLYEDDGVSLGYLGGESAVIPIAHQGTPAGRTITVGRSRGHFKSFARWRTLEVRLPASAPPAAVKVGRERLRWQYRLGERGWTYDGPTATTIIRLDRFDVTRGVRISVVDDPQSPARLADALAGLMRRLWRVSQHNNLASPVHPVHPDERLAVDVAQAGNRIGRDPAVFAAELRRMRRLLKRLPAALKEFEAAWRKKGQPKRADYIKQARGILKTTLEQF